MLCRKLPVSVVSKEGNEKTTTTFKDGSRYLVLDLGGTKKEIDKPYYFSKGTIFLIQNTQNINL